MNINAASSSSIGQFPSAVLQWGFWESCATAAAFVALGIARALYLSQRPSIARAPAVLLVAKLVAGVALSCLRLGLFLIAIERHNSDDDGARSGRSGRSGRQVALAALDLAAACVLVALSPLEHFKSRRPSFLTCPFLLLALVYDVARIILSRAAASWDDVVHVARNHYAYSNSLFKASVGVEFAFLVLESTRRERWVVAWEKDANGDATATDHSPEETSGILSLGLYSWLTPLLWRGYREPLTMDHLYALDPAISVATLDAQSTQPSLSGEPRGGTSTWQLILWLAKPLGMSALLPIFPRLFLIGFTFCQPFFLERLLRFLSSPEEDDPSAAYGFVAVAVATYTGIAISTALYWYYQERFQSLLRAFLISAIYRKTNHIRHVGDGDPAAVTLMGTDVERIYTGLRYMHEVWAGVIQIALAGWLLQREIGLGFLAALVVVTTGFAGSLALSRRAVRYQGAWMGRVQARIGFTSSVLGHIKDLRVSGMTGPAAALLQHEREDEIRVGERSRMLVVTSASLSQLPHAVAPALAFAFGPHVLNQARAFTALTYLSLLTSPLMTVLQILPITAACIACLRRTKLFLMQDGRVDGRLLEAVDNLHVHDRVESRSTDMESALVVVEDGCFSWTIENLILSKINLCLPKSSITFVVGPVASGKSTLCRALLGEVPYVQGKVVLRSDKLGYCDQVPFLFNASIMDNIIGFSPFDVARYTDVIEATKLTEDLRNLPSGDRTVVGTKGVSLSGGQRQRISLARALYHHADILVFDDVFSGLDGSTQDQVCQSVFGRDGLLRKRGTTALVCTHSTHFLSVADHIVALSSDGTIADRGGLAEITQDEERARRVGLTVVSPDPITRKLDGPGDAEGQGTEPTAETTSLESENENTVLSKPQATPPTSQSVGIGVYRRWLSTIGVKPVLFFLVLVIGVGFFSNFSTIWLKLWSADSVSSSPRHSFAFWIGIYALIGAGTILCLFPAGLTMLRTAVRLAGTDLHHAAVDTIMHSSLRFLGATDVGKVLNLFSQDMNIMDTQLPRMVNNLSFTLANALGQAVVIAVSSAWVAMSYPFFLGSLWVVQRVYFPTSKRLRILDLEAKTPLYTNFLDTLAGLPTIRAFGWFPQQLARNNALLDDSQRPSYLLAMAQQWLTLTMNVIVAILAVMLVILATQLGSDAGNVGAGLVTLIALGGTLTSIVSAYTGLDTSLGAISRLINFEEETELESRNKDDVVPDQAWPMAARVQMRGVDASYGADGADKVLELLDLTFEAGEKVAICGRTGSGKSSILALLLRLIEPLPSSNQFSTVPTIIIDDIPLGTIDHTALRERVISASQDAVFLPDGTSFRINLDPWGAASDGECIKALQDLELATVMEAKGGLTVPIGSWAELSGGQKQLFSVARAVLRRRVKLRKTGIDGGLLLLDEITSSADAETEMKVMKVLGEEFGKYTVVLVTHKREMAMAAERVVVLDKGRVVEMGRPGELLGKEGGWFRRLFEGAGGRSESSSGSSSQ
ncbi:P-loop containing nucleoside triphosphate hydrolase protein [Bombardia bombarda]|uniref:P-loop containing nucleoside triphosphate hydrolase protein n=1 Tax=Bombardia bombarda TaxID=252184 RepID=A0AA39U2F2_9PEZI|nr:P-loop containing nucleoside triphosphate hydrolase protein [Bombardia bombarda]